MEKFYTVHEIAAAMKLSPYTIRRRIKAKKLSAVKVGRIYRIKQKDLEEFIG